MNHAQKVQYRLLVALLFVVLIYFWVWWLRPEHNIGTFSYVLNVIVLAWLTLLPLYFVLILSRARVPAQLPVPPGYRWCALISGELANLARRAQSDACLWQYVMYGAVMIRHPSGSLRFCLR